MKPSTRIRGRRAHGWPLALNAAWLVSISPLACSSTDHPGVAAGAAGASGSSSVDVSAGGTSGGSAGSAQGGSSGAVDASLDDGGDGASGAAGATACMEASPDPTACSQCIQLEACTAESEACDSNPDCQLYSDCLSQCEDDACSQDCVDQFGDGRGDYELLQGCAYAGCHAVCLEPGCPWGKQDGEECEACVRENCCAECTAAVTDRETMAAVFCMQACSDQAGVSDCFQKYPAANEILTSFVQCMDGFCGTACP